MDLGQVAVDEHRGRCWCAGLGRPRRHSVARSISSPSVAPSSHAPPERQVASIQQRELEPAGRRELIRGHRSTGGRPEL